MEPHPELLTADGVRFVLLQALAEIAPEAAAAAIEVDVPLRDQVDLDSFDFLNFMIAIHARTGVEVPEADYGRVATLRGAVEYVMAKASLGARQ